MTDQKCSKWPKEVCTIAKEFRSKVRRKHKENMIYIVFFDNDNVHDNDDDVRPTP